MSTFLIVGICVAGLALFACAAAFVKFRVIPYVELNYGPYAFFHKKRVSLKREIFSMQPYERRLVEEDQLVAHVIQCLEMAGITGCQINTYTQTDSAPFITLCFISPIEHTITVTGECKIGKGEIGGWTSTHEAIRHVIDMACTLYWDRAIKVRELLDSE